MKRLIWFLIFAALLVVFCVTVGRASDFSMEVKGGMYMPTGDTFQQGQHIQINDKWKDLYIFGSYTMMSRRIAGQRAGDFKILGVGVGLDVPVHKYLSIWGQLGYYMPKTDFGKGTDPKDWDSWGNYQEVHYLYWQKWGSDYQYATQGYRQYEYKLASGNLGGAIGIDLAYPISNHLTVGMTTGYQLLKFTETFYARNAYNPQVSYIQTRQDADMSGFILGVNLTYRF